jgi:hypothetical protein
VPTNEIAIVVKTKAKGLHPAINARGVIDGYSAKAITTPRVSVYPVMALEGLFMQ